ncbi:MAG: DUF1343 domain-containing protein [Chitinophagaceae bacterium]
MFLKFFLIPLSIIVIETNCTGQQKIKIKSNGTKTKVKQTAPKIKTETTNIIPAADQLDKYLPMLKGKKVAMLVNQTSQVGGVHLVDVLRKNGVTIKVIFGPEHGFRGNAPDGAKIETTTDPETGIPVVSLYGKKNKPSKEDLQDVDVMLYDIQDVGTRFYTFISSMQLFLEAAVENNIPLVILDRPNPNGFYVDGPVLDLKYKSFVGMQPVPINYGMTIGEYATMILQQGWLSEEANKKWQNIIASRYAAGAKYFHLDVIPVANYTHKSKYVLPVRPSPNLPDMAAIYWYPTNCLFEGTVISEGRGTEHPFATIGHPSLPKNLFSFTPHSTEGAPSPKYKDQVCYGWNLYGSNEEVLKMVDNKIQLKYLLQAYQSFPDKQNFFKEAGFNRLAGNNELIQQIKEGKSEEEIRRSWEPKLTEFKKIRKQYLLYPDFE